MRKRWSAILLALAVVAGLTVTGEGLFQRQPTKRIRQPIKVRPLAAMGEACFIPRGGIRDTGRVRVSSCMISPMQATGEVRYRFLP